MPVRSGNESASWSDLAALTPLPAGVEVVRDATTLTVRSLLPGRLRPAVAYAILTVLALGVLGFTLHEHPLGRVIHILWWAMVVISAITVAVAIPLLVAVLRAHRVLVLNPGVLILNEYHGLRASGITCLRSNLRTLAAVLEVDHSTLHLELEMEISPTVQRIMKLDLQPDADETVLAVATFCQGERREIVLYLGRLIAEWAQLDFSPPQGSASSSRISDHRRR